MMSFFKSFGCGINLNESGSIVHLNGDSVDSDLLVDNSFKLTLDASYEQFLSSASLYHNILPTAKCSRFFLQSSRLWHKHFGHIFKLHYLVKICVSWLSRFFWFLHHFLLYLRKIDQIKKKIESEKSTDPFQLIHTDIYRFFLPLSEKS